MRGRVMNVTFKRELIDEAITEWPKYTANFKGRGLQANYMLVNRDTGKALSVTLWDNQDSIDANESRPELEQTFQSFRRFYEDEPYWDYYDVGAASQIG